MNVNEHDEVAEYCKIRCKQNDCSRCKYEEYVYCRMNFVFELYDIIDRKTLEFNNIGKILNDLFTLFAYGRAKHEESYSNVAKDAISELLSNKRYKAIKKVNYDKLIKNKGEIKC